MRIGIDARFLSHPQPGGFKTYTRNLVTALARVGFDHEYVLYTDRSMGHEFPVREKNITVRVVPGTVPFVGVPLREQFLLPERIIRDAVELVHFPCLTAPVFAPCPFVVTVYDAIWLSAPPFSKWSPKRLAMWLYTRYVPLPAIRKARAIITISQAAKRDLVQRLDVQTERISVTYLAASPVFRAIGDEREMEAVRHGFGLGSEFILSIGSADPRKNIAQLVRAYACLESNLRNRYQLVIVWTHRLLRDRIAALVEELGLQGDIRFLEGVSDEDLARLYGAATLFVFPSLYEGFGLPPLEAMACGTPVVAADNSSIPEVVGDAALLADVRDPAAMASIMSRVLEDTELQQCLREKGLSRARMFSWERCARETIAVYEAVAKGL